LVPDGERKPYSEMTEKEREVLDAKMFQKFKDDFRAWIDTLGERKGGLADSGDCSTSF